VGREVLAGDDDKPPSQVADLRRFVYRRAGHVPYETHPDAYVATVLAFISRGPMF
jgi:pimeloyl-ACP methyl ester carboxylesterase